MIALMRLSQCLTLIAVLVLSACRSDPIPEYGRANLQGKWVKDAIGAVLTIREDGSFVLGTSSGAPGVAGRIERGRERLSVSYDSTASGCGRDFGQYLFDQKGKTLVLRPVDDPCPERMRTLAGSWRRP